MLFIKANGRLHSRASAIIAASNCLKPGEMKNKKIDPKPGSGAPPATKRRYNSPLRQQQTLETRERIVAAGAKLVHTYPAWDWTNLTALAVGECAGVSERTVQRHFPTERLLRDAVLQRVYEESGIGLDEVKLDTFADVTARMFAYLSSFATTPQVQSDPTFLSMDQQRCDALLKAVVAATPGWTAQQQKMAAAVLDIVWNPPTYERLITTWGFDRENASDVLTWLIGVMEKAIRDGQRPPP
jgi:AcrR family transcriptional regulator